ncbi:hypothetical protein Taro_052296, partial [Colocasia esculenta]|nr:hypothetical protein [Colocasia esculenta]
MRPDSPSSHCLSLPWFRSHVVVSGVRPQLGQAAVLRVLCVSVAALSRPCAGVEAGARLARRACGLRVPLLAARGGGLVAVVVTAFSSQRFQVFLIALACTTVLALLYLAPVGVVGLALGRPVLLVVPASVFSWFCSPILGCQPVIAPACVASRPGSVSGARGGSACGPSTLCAEHCFRFVPDSVGFCGSSVCATTSFPIFGVPTALAGEGLVIPTGPCSRGSPPYFLQLGARCRGSSVSDGLQRRLWRRVLSAAVRVSVVSSCSLSELRAMFCKSS